MKDRYDFSKGKRGRVLPPEPEPLGKDPGSRFSSTKISWVAFFRWRKRPGERPVIRPSSMLRFRNTWKDKRRDSTTLYGASFVRN